MIVIIAVVLFFIHSQFQSASSISDIASSTTSHSFPLPSTTDDAGCLANNEIASYTTTNNRNKRIADVGTVVVANKEDGTQIFSFSINDVDASHYHGYELHNCGIYVIRQFNYDYLHGSAMPGYRQELWKFGYNGISMKLTEVYDFRVSPNESTLSFSPFLTTSTDSSVILENLKTKQTVFTILPSEVAQQNPNIIADIGFYPGGWSDDSKYFWFNFSQAADVLGFVRFNTSDDSYQAFTAPTTTMGGDAFNPNTGMTTYETNVAPWTGSSEIDQQYRNQAAQSGQVSSFYVYDLLTKQNYLVATTTDPTYYFQPKWLSDSVLQYTLQSGATSTYAVPQ